MKPARISHELSVAAPDPTASAAFPGALPRAGRVAAHILAPDQARARVYAPRPLLSSVCRMPHLLVIEGPAFRDCSGNRAVIDRAYTGSGNREPKSLNIENVAVYDRPNQVGVSGEYMGLNEWLQLWSKSAGTNREDS